MSKSHSGLFSGTSGTWVNSINITSSSDVNSCSVNDIDTPMYIFKETIIPPDVLYYITTYKAHDSIMQSGLKPIDGRKYVRLLVDIDKDVQINRCRDPSHIILKIDAAKAHKDGIKFYKGSENVILVNYVPKQYIAIGSIL